MNRLKDKIALITGAASGLGREDALLFAREGARLVLTDINAAGGEAVATEINKDFPGSALFVKHDVSSEADWRSVMQRTIDSYGRLDILINNAAILVQANIEQTTPEIWERVQRINSQSCFLGCKYGIEQMKTHGGSIVNMSSLAAIAGMSEFCAYSASKGAVAALSRNVAVHCKRKGYTIRCNSVHPDGILTPMVFALAPKDVAPAPLPPEVAARMHSPADVAKIVLFLASDDSKLINGQEVRVDNGYLIEAD